jgi:transposase-like protein
MNENVKCPVCGQEFKTEPLKTWKFRFYRVSRFECKNCKTKFNFYVSSKSKFTIPKSPKRTA